MRRLGIVLLALLAPTAAAWTLAAHAPIAGEPSLSTSLMLSGAIVAQGPQAAFAAPRLERASFGVDLTASYCEDVGGEPRADQCARPPQTTTGATLHVIRGGLVVWPLDEGPSVLEGPQAVGAAGGANLSLNGVAMGPSLFAAGPVALTHPGAGFRVRPLSTDSAIELRGEQGFRLYNGTGYTLTLQGAQGARIEADGGILAIGPNGTIALTRAGPGADLDITGVFDVLRAVQPPATADRRGDLLDAFGPFAEVDALRDGAIAMREGLAVNGSAVRNASVVVRVDDATVTRDEANWTVRGNGTYLVRGAELMPEPGRAAQAPYLVAGVLLLAATGARLYVKPTALPRPTRVRLAALRSASLALLALAAGVALEATLGAHAFQPGLDAPARVRLALAAALLGALVLLGAAWPAESLTRALLTWRKRASDGFAPVAAGLLLGLLVVLAWRPGLVEVVLRIVRL